jgi:ATP/ADP translocase/HEAT repeat protein
VSAAGRSSASSHTATKLERDRLAFLDTLLARFGIRSGEGRRTALLFTYLLAASAVFILGRTVRDTLFLSRYPLTALPWMFVLFGVTSALTVVLYSRFADRVSRSKLVAVSTGVGAITYLATFALVRIDVPWIYPTFYVWSEVVANLLIVQFWTIANDLHDSRGARRLFPTIGAARVLGVVVIGVVSGAVVRLVGTAQLLFVLVALMGLIAVLAQRLSRFPRVDTGTTRKRQGPPARIAGDKYVQVLSIMILLAFAALTIGDYQFKAIARATFREDELARFFSLFYAATGAIAFAFQVFVTPRLLGRFGVGLGLAVMPVVFGVGAALLPILPVLSVATAMKFADNGLQYTVHETSLQALYGPFRAEVKARTRAFLDAVIKPVSYGIGGMVLVLLAQRVDVQYLSIITVALVIGWLLVIPRVRARYVAALEQTIGARGVGQGGDFVFDARANRGLLEVLERGRPAAILIALDQLEGEQSAAFGAVLQRLAASPVAAVRAAALRRMAGVPNADPHVAVVALDATDPVVRAAAVRATAALLGDDALEHLLAHANDPSQDVRVAVLAGLLAHAGVEGAIEGGRKLAELLASVEPDARIEATRVLRELGGAAYRPVRALLADPVPEVRRAALRAAQHVADVRLLPVLVDALHRPATRGRAASALVAIGEPAVAPLASLLANPSVMRSIRLVLPRILREIPSPTTYATLRLQTQVPDGHIRLRVLAAMSSVRARIGRIRESRDHVLEMVRFEIGQAYRNMAAWQKMRARYDTKLLHEEFDFRRQRAYRRVLRVLELRYDRSALKLVRNVIDRAGGRSAALEVLDSILEPLLRPVVLPFFDEVRDVEKVERAGDLSPSVGTAEAFLLEQCRHSNPFVVAIAIEALHRANAPEAAEAAVSCVGHVDPLVRETALRTLSALGESPPPLCARDPDPVVARLARALLDPTAATPARPPMYSTLEKILMLKGTPLFSTVAAEDLSSLARLAEERSFAAGERIVAQGEVGDELYLIMSGSVLVTRDGHDVTTLGPGEAFGEMSVLDAGPRTATCTAATDTEVLAVTSEEFYEILYEQAEIAEGVIRMLVKRLREGKVGT